MRITYKYEEDDMAGRALYTFRSRRTYHLHTAAAVLHMLRSLHRTVAFPPARLVVRLATDVVVLVRRGRLCRGQIGRFAD